MSDDKLQEKLAKSNETDVKAVLVMKEKAKRRLMEEPSASNIAAFDRAVTLLKRLTERDQDNETDINSEKPFGNRLDVWNYLVSEGWLVSKSGFYTHCADGKLSLNKDGNYESKAVNKYAKTYLRRKETGKKVAEQQEELQEQKLKAEIKRLTAQAAKAEHELMVAEGKYIPREEVDLELVGRAVVLDNGLSHWIQTAAAAWIDLVDGENAKVSDLVALAMSGKDKVLNEFALKREYQVEHETGN